MVDGPNRDPFADHQPFPEVDTSDNAPMSAPERVRARRLIRRNVLVASIGFAVLGILGFIIGPGLHVVLAVPIVLIVAGMFGALLALALHHASEGDRPLRG